MKAFYSLSGNDLKGLDSLILSALKNAEAGIKKLEETRTACIRKFLGIFEYSTVDPMRLDLKIARIEDSVDILQSISEKAVIAWDTGSHGFQLEDFELEELRKWGDQ